MVGKLMAPGTQKNNVYTCADDRMAAIFKGKT